MINSIKKLFRTNASIYDEIYDEINSQQILINTFDSLNIKPSDSPSNIVYKANLEKAEENIKILNTVLVNHIKKNMDYKILNRLFDKPLSNEAPDAIISTPSVIINKLFINNVYFDICNKSISKELRNAFRISTLIQLKEPFKKKIRQKTFEKILKHLVSFDRPAADYLKKMIDDPFTDMESILKMYSISLNLLKYSDTKKILYSKHFSIKELEYLENCTVINCIIIKDIE